MVKVSPKRTLTREKVMENKLELARGKIIVALDGCTPREALPIVENLAPFVWGFKVGLEMITAITAGILSGAIMHLKNAARMLVLCLRQWETTFSGIRN